jgi:hypothetical protein
MAKKFYILMAYMAYAWLMIDVWQSLIVSGE